MIFKQNTNIGHDINHWTSDYLTSSIYNMKTLKDFKEEITPKTAKQKENEFLKSNYRAADAIYLGIICIIINIIVILASKFNLLEIRMNSFDDYINFRVKIVLFSLLERVFWVFIIAKFADKVNRQPLPWQIFAFFFPYLALIIIGLTKKKATFFYEYKKADDKLHFFESLVLTDKLKLYNHILIRARVSPFWLDRLAAFNELLFADEQTSLETLNTYEELFSRNLLKEFKSNMPLNKEDRIQFFKPLVKIGLIEESYYLNKDVSDE